MPTEHHTPHPFGAPVTSAQFNSRLSELDQAIADAIQAGFVGASTTLAAQANAGQPVLSVQSATGFFVGDVVWIGFPGSGITESGTIASIATNNLTLSANLTNTHAVGEPVSRSPVELVASRGIYGTLPARLTALEAAIDAVDAKVIHRAAATRAALDAGTSANPVLIAHRGLSLAAPENTRAAFRAALGSTATGMETDVQWSSDRQPIMLHDTTLSRTTGLAAGPTNYSLAELLATGAGSWFNAAWATERMPSLRDYMGEFGPRMATIYEVKATLDGT